jgi:hypothetical protein
MIAAQVLKRAARIGLTAVKGSRAPAGEPVGTWVPAGRSAPDKVSVARFRATRSAGAPTVVIARTTLIDVPVHGGTGLMSSEGYTQLATGRCETLIWRAKGVYEVGGSREIIRCDDPNAP